MQICALHTPSSWCGHLVQHTSGTPQQPCLSAPLTQLHINPRQSARHRTHTARVAAVAAAIPDAADSAAPSSRAAAASAWQQQQQHSKRSRTQLPQVVEASSQGVYAGRLLIKSQPAAGYGSLPGSLKELRGGLPRGVTDALNLPGQQQQQQQQPSQHLQSLADKNRSFSGALRQVQGLGDLLNLLESPQWGQCLCDLDGVSVVGALVAFVRSTDWQQLQQQRQSAPEQQRQRQRGQHAIQMLLDRASALVMPQQQQQQQQQPGVPLMRPAELANLMYCTTKLGHTRHALLAAAAAALTDYLYACSNVELFRLIWGLAAARVHPGVAWLLSFCKAAQAQFSSAEPSQLAIMVYGLARLGYRPPDIWIAAWLEVAESQLLGFSAQNLTNAAWGLSCWRFQAPEHWLQSFYAASGAAMPQFTAIGVSQLALALVTLGGGTPPPAAWLEALVQAAQPLLPRMQLLQLCNLGWGLAQWGHRPSAAVMGSYLAASERLLAAATPTDLSTMLWICDKLSYVPQQSWLEAWFGAAAASLPRCEPQHLTTMALVLGRWGLVPAAGFSVEYWRTSKARFGHFTAYQLGLLLWGLGRTRRSVPATWTTSALASFCQLLLQEAEPEDACRLLAGLSHVYVKPRGSQQWAADSASVQQQLQALCGWLQPQLRQLQPYWLLVLVRALRGLGVRVEPEFQDALEGAAADLGDQLTPQQRHAVEQELRKLRQGGSNSGTVSVMA